MVGTFWRFHATPVYRCIKGDKRPGGTAYFDPVN